MQQAPKAILNSIEAIHLPSISQILLRFLRLAEDDSTSMAELAELVGQDPSLTARILTVANSPALRRGEQTTNLLQCLVNLGTRLARTLAACLVVQKVFEPATDSRHYDLTGFWGHSLRVAKMSRALASEINYSGVEEAYLAGLLHDIGQLLLLGGMEERYGELLASSRDECALREREEEQLGTDHAAIGAWLVDQWSLSSFMADSILFHHTPPEMIGTADTLSQILWSAHVICRHHKLLDAEHTMQLPELAAVNAMLGIDAPRAASIYRHCSESVALIAEALNITEAADAKTLPVAISTSPENVRTRPEDHDRTLSRMEDMVRDLAMMQPLQESLASLDSETEMLLAVRETTRILFGLGQVAFLLIQPDKPLLSGADIADRPELLQKLEISLDAGQSLAAAAVVSRSACTTFDKELPVAGSLIDLQIARVLGSEGLLYVPLSARRHSIGVMVCGVNAAQALRIGKQLGLLTNFARMAADCIEGLRDVRDRELKLAANLTTRFEQQSRKVVHEAGNPLGIIKNYLKIIRRKLPDEHNMQQELDILKEEIDRVTLIVQRMNGLAGALPPAGELDVTVVIENMLLLYGESLFSSRGITLETSLDRRAPAIAGDRDSLKQILFNLWNNAADVMPDGGRFAISTHDDVNQNGRVYLEIRLSDTGPGLPPDVMQSLYKPLDPNRRPGHSGVGLSIVAGLVEHLDGRITCTSITGKGTCFSILLPKSGRNEQ